MVNGVEGGNGQTGHIETIKDPICLGFVILHCNNIFPKLDCRVSKAEKFCLHWRRCRQAQDWQATQLFTQVALLASFRFEGL